jgi:hypothetical protein
MAPEVRIAPPPPSCRGRRNRAQTLFRPKRQGAPARASFGGGDGLTFPALRIFKSRADTVTFSLPLAPVSPSGPKRMTEFEQIAASIAALRGAVDVQREMGERNAGIAEHSV